MNRVRLTACALAIGIAQAAAASAQSDPSNKTPIFGLVDNSFFVEEAFNQDPGVVQNMLLWSRDRDGQWQASFTQEWPVWSHAHQLSYSIPWDGGDSPTRLEQVTVNYRYQLMDEAAGHPAISPRLTLILPTGRRDGDGDRPGLQVNLPVSKEAGHLYLHGNAGATWIRGPQDANDIRANLTSPHVGGSVIWAAKPMAQLMLETAVVFEQSIDAEAHKSRSAVLTVSPGFRGGWNIGSRQIVIGVGVPVTRESGEQSVAALGYFSYEGPFRARRSRPGEEP